MKQLNKYEFGWCAVFAWLLANTVAIIIVERCHQTEINELKSSQIHFPVDPDLLVPPSKFSPEK